jgi:hypothetical protein
MVRVCFVRAMFFATSIPALREVRPQRFFIAGVIMLRKALSASESPLVPCFSSSP